MQLRVRYCSNLNYSCHTEHTLLLSSASPHRHSRWSQALSSMFLSHQGVCIETSVMHPCTCSLPSSPSISNFISAHPPLSMLESQCTNMRDLHQLHCQLIKTGLAKDTIACSRLLAFCATAADGLDYAQLLFSHTHNPNAFMYNTLIRGLSQSCTPYKAISLFFDMLHSPTPPERLTFPSLFVAFGQLGLAQDASQLHGMVLKLGLAADPYIRNSMISMYAACGCMDTAVRLFLHSCPAFDIVSCNSMIMGFSRISLVDESRCLFDQMPARNDITWSSMISGYVRNGKNKEALDLFHRMQEIGLKPNICTLVSILGACSCLGALQQGQWVHGYIKNNNFEVNTIVTTAIIDMYCKCGSIDEAVEVFEDTRKKGLSSWNSIISGLALHGQANKAIQYFSRLQSSSLRPDHVSFVGILTACSHSGMVNEAQYYFSLMTDVYGIEPGIEHYGCMVDVLGRAGLVEEAEELIHSMHIRPDTAIWGSLLSACRIYGCAEIGKKAAAEINKVDPGDSGGYVLLSNTYSSSGGFMDAMSTRGKMKQNGVWKKPGCSMIEVNGVAHEFVANGVLHNRAREIYEVLNRMALKLNEASCTELSLNEYI